MRSAILVGLLISFALTSSSSAQQATPVATPMAIDPGECTTEPRPIGEMRGLVEAGLPQVVASIAGTPIASGTPRPRAISGEPADAATVAAVTDVVMQFAACTETGDLPAIAALLTEDGAAAYLSFGFLSFRSIVAGGWDDTPSADIDPMQLNLYLGALQLHAPLPADVVPTLYGIESVTQLDDGRVQVIALMATGSEEPSQTSIVLRKEDGRYRMIFGRDTGVAAVSTPAP
jgi:hypothetical protein